VGINGSWGGDLGESLFFLLNVLVIAFNGASVS
jgi:hypothetical protein